MKGEARQAHTGACRNRVEKEFQGTPKMVDASRRVQEYLKKAEECQYKKEQRPRLEGNA